MNPPEKPTLEHELAATERLRFAADADRRRLRAEVEKWQSVAATMSSEREHNANEAGRLRAELAVAENWVEHHSKHADDLIGENVKLRADLERFTGHGLLDCHAICDQRDAAVARAERAEAELACEKENRNHLIEKGAKLETELVQLRAQENDYVKLIAEVLKCNPRSACDQPDNQLEAPWEVVARLRAEVKLAEWSVLKLWGGTPEIIHEFIKAQQNRIHHCQDLEAEFLEQARLLGMSGEREADLLGKIERLAKDKARLDWLEAHALPQHSPYISISDLGRHYNGFPGSFRAAIDAAMKEARK